MTDLSQPMTLILFVLARGAAWGYAIMTKVEAATDGDYSISAGTLYRSLWSLVQLNFIEELSDDSASADDARRRVYRITDTGRQAVAAEFEKLERLVEVARKLNLLDQQTETKAPL